jgi:putative transposase
MPRSARCVPPESVVHIVNRGNDRRQLFDTAGDYDEFLDLFDLARQQNPVPVLAYALMPNHWHFLLWPRSPAALSQFLHSLTMRHAARLRKSSGTVGGGHVYQARFRSTVVRDAVQYIRTVRYVETNPLRAKFVGRAEDWKWTSLFERLREPRRLADGPVALPPPAEWVSFLNCDPEREGDKSPEV